MADVFQLTKSITGITFSPAGRATLSMLPAKARLRVSADSSLSGFIDVIYDDKRFCIFNVDLMERSVTLRTMSASG